MKRENKWSPIFSFWAAISLRAETSFHSVRKVGWIVAATVWLFRSLRLGCST
uniref:Uncharacterized protein n=1 Tax=Picea glauca TaxID=3330 RepID=A0A117NGB0_PICGL|nr:hypothetical protein ABT39_MTgene1624 [Picea glauca]